jgi:hypothetical protein
VRAPSPPHPPPALIALPRRSNNQIGDEGVAALADSLHGLMALKELYLQ